MIDEFLNKNKDNILNDICDLIKIPSVSNEEDARANMPFGKYCNDALVNILNKASSMGFKTKNMDGYCCYIEFGSGKELLGIIGHLDVVPGGDGWTKCPPFDPVILDNKLYGRGAIDDKGPVIASLYAMKYVMDNFNVNKRVRLIIGLSEENTWNCVKYYKEHEELPTIGFSPDADFPCIYAEKAFLNAYVSSKYEPKLSDNIKIVDLVCDNVINAVPKDSTIVLEITNINIDDIKQSVNNLINEYKYNIDIEIIDSNHIKLISNGITSHGAYPHLGTNALTRLIVLTNDLLSNYNINIPIFKFISSRINTEYDGKLLDISCEDESGILTLNVGNVTFNNDIINFGLNIRIPVSVSSSKIKEKIDENISIFDDLTVEYKDEKEALYIPKNNYLVTTLCDIYNDVTNDNKEPITCSGATYARAFKNVVSFGAIMPDEENMCHKADEYIDINNLFTCIEIYIKAILKLAN